MKPVPRVRVQLKQLLSIAIQLFDVYRNNVHELNHWSEGIHV